MTQQTVLLVGATGMLGSQIARRRLDHPEARVSVDRATREVAVIVSAVQGGPDVIVDGQVALAEAGEDAADRLQAVTLAYQLYMLTGQTALTDLQNDRDPDVRFECFAAFADRALPHGAFA